MTAAPVLQNKLRPPNLRGDLVRRARVFALLDRALEVPLTVVSAPAGFGKSTAVASWLAARGVHHAWLSLDEADNDRTRSARHLVRALASLGDPEAMPPVDVGQDVDLRIVVTRALDDVRTLQRDSVIVLDDYHLIDAKPIHDAAAFLVANLPPKLHLVIATRADPPFPLARLRAAGQLTEVRADDLRFMTDEAAALLSAIGAARLSGQDLDVLVTRSEGWAAGLKLAALSLAETGDAPAFVRSFSGTNRFILDYLVEEVLEKQPREVRSFLLETSILGTLTAGACDAVTGRSDGQTMLEHLERANLFTVALDDDRRAYRYHHLFSELLRARLRQLRPGAEAVLHARAAEWYELQGSFDEALRHAVDAHDTERALALLERSWSRYVLLGEFDTFRRWLDALPREAVDRHPSLCAARAWIPIVQGHVEGIESAVAEVEAALAREDPYGEPDVLSTVPAQVSLMRGAVALVIDRDPERAVACAAEARRILPADLPTWLRTIFDGMTALQTAQAHQFLGALDEAAAEYREALPHLWASANTFGVAEATMYLARVEERRGHRERALAACNETLARAADAGLERAPALGPVHLALAEIALASGDRDAAVREATGALDRGRLMGSASIVTEAQALLDRLQGTAEARARRGASLVEPLTQREREILRLLAAGRSNRQIAEELVVALGTVKAHVHAISAKLGSESRLQAVARARSVGLID